MFPEPLKPLTSTDWLPRKTGWWLLCGLIVSMVAILYSSASLANETMGVEKAGSEWICSLQEELFKGFDWRLKTLGYGIVQDPVDSPLNPYNFLEINHYQAELDFRPDLFLRWRSLDLSVKPRAEFYWKRWEDGARKGDSHGDYDLFVNEWLARYMVKEELFGSYGRENLQWGPSLLISPSNPFNEDNGKNNPYKELPGLDYARMVWIPSQSFSGSFIANLGEGQKEYFGEFHKQYALKFDYTGYKKYFSLIPAYMNSNDYQLGFFGGWSPSDALLLYTEGKVQNGSGVSYLAGGSYTLEMGPTLSLEYFHNASGCTGPIQECFPPYGEASFDQTLFRKNYVLVQLLDTRIRNSFNIILRWIGDVDDGSSRSVGIAEYELGDHTKIFAVGNYFCGNKDTEFGSLLAYSAFFGMEYNF